MNLFKNLELKIKAIKSSANTKLALNLADEAKEIADLLFECGELAEDEHALIIRNIAEELGGYKKLGKYI
jgi:hypothetical protein